MKRKHYYTRRDMHYCRRDSVDNMVLFWNILAISLFIINLIFSE